MMPARALFALLVFPGLLYALPAGWLMLGIERRLRARLQRRIGPPLSQPFYDFVKLLGKWPAPRLASDLLVLTGLPLLAVGCLVGAIALIPVAGSRAGFVGDVILFATLLEMPSLCLVLAGYASRSIYGEVGSTREAVLGIASNVPFLAAIMAMATAAGTAHLATLADATPWVVRVPALAAIFVCLPVKLRLNPFSLTNAEQEVLAGPLTEFDGPRLALWELAHALEWVALAGFAAVLAVPYRPASWLADAVLFAAVSIGLVPLLALLAAATGRLKISQATRILWRWGNLAAAVAFVFALLLRQAGR